MPDSWDRDISDQKDIELKVDLAELFSGQLVPDSSRLREAIGQEIIDIIRERTQDAQKSWTGSSFKNYSKEYSETIDFKAYDKERDEPNLTQTGDMLGLMTVKSSSDPGLVVIGWDDSLQSEKAHGHITGAVGVKRDFFGLNSSEIKRLKEKFESELESAPQTTQKDFTDQASNFLEGRRSIAESSLGSIIDSFFGDEGL